MRENPCRYGPAALGPNFTDRATELETLVRDMRSRQNVVIVSPRRYSRKSSPNERSLVATPRVS